MGPCCRGTWVNQESMLSTKWTHRKRHFSPRNWYEKTKAHWDVDYEIIIFFWSRCRFHFYWSWQEYLWIFFFILCRLILKYQDGRMKPIPRLIWTTSPMRRRPVLTCFYVSWALFQSIDQDFVASQCIYIYIYIYKYTPTFLLVYVWI